MSQDSEEPELESQFILRLPPEKAAAIRSLLRAGDAAIRDKLKIDLASDARRAVVQADGVSLAGTVMDLPCMVGSLKTLDGKTFYHTADISQMLVCGGDPQASPEAGAGARAGAGAGAGAHAGAGAGASAGARARAGAAAIAAEDVGTSEAEPKEKYLWKHGLTPPLKNVRKKRFRKIRRKLPDSRHAKDGGADYDSPEVQKEVRRLLCSDAEAMSCRWEIVEEDSKGVLCQGSVPGLPIVPASSRPVPAECGTALKTCGPERDMDDDDDDDDDEEEEEKEEDSEEELERELQAKFIECSLSEGDEAYGSVVMGIQKLILHKEKKLHEIKGKAQRQRDLLKQVENLTLKSHFRSALEQLNLQKKEKYEQIMFLKEQLNSYLKR